MSRHAEGPVLRITPGGIWSVRFRHNGRRFELSTKSRDQREAERIGRWLYEQTVTSRCVRRAAMRPATITRALGHSPIFPWPETRGVYCACVFTGYVKIGRANNIANRMTAFQTHTPEDVKLLAVLSENPLDERAFHLRFAAWRVRGEWFRFDAGFAAALKEALKA